LDTGESYGVRVAECAEMKDAGGRCGAERDAPPRPAAGRS
jgi:hypothetical protein